MKLKDQVCSLKLAKKLKKLGVNQESEFYYMQASDEYTKDSEHGSLSCGLSGYFGKNTEPYVLGMMEIIGMVNCKNYYSAFTVAELIFILGKKFGILDKFKNGEFGAYIPNDCSVHGMGKTPCEALANLIIKTWDYEK